MILPSSELFEQNRVTNIFLHGE